MSESLERQLQRAYRYAAKGDTEGWKTTLEHAIIQAREMDQQATETATDTKKAVFWKTATVTLRQRTVDLYDRYDNNANATYERVFNSILDTEEDPNPSMADDERDRWLIERTWLSTLSTVLDFMPTGDDQPSHAEIARQVLSMARGEM